VFDYIAENKWNGQAICSRCLIFLQIISDFKNSDFKNNHAIKKLSIYNLQPFTFTGCGGYIYGEGIISTPNYLSSSGIVECFWFVETRQSEHTILMRNNFSDIKITALLSRAHPEMIASLYIVFFSLLICFLLLILHVKKLHY
jgi:hypothetical protein